MVGDPAAIARYQQMLQPWTDRQMDYVIAIRPRVITGLRVAGL